MADTNTVTSPGRKGNETTTFTLQELSFRCLFSSHDVLLPFCLSLLSLFFPHHLLMITHKFPFVSSSIHSCRVQRKTFSSLSLSLNIFLHFLRLDSCFFSLPLSSSPLLYFSSRFRPLICFDSLLRDTIPVTGNSLDRENDRDKK